jgi:hypothetical protein
MPRLMYKIYVRNSIEFYLKNGLKNLEITGYVKSKHGGNYLFVFLKKNYLIWEGGFGC